MHVSSYHIISSFFLWVCYWWDLLSMMILFVGSTVNKNELSKESVLNERMFLFKLQHC
ncbi:hypothetical protein HanXRQr2_Chr03g0097911 [Helianthus annuus]|uniref:Uncharacterized protein n=1 Tax=Helianthus annuus TaxID=4232 RepID=A0A9K3JDE5_HELAN|nr:hypothetical protein HanXRQr2_Chr03g0097911 [Helianthus annuus]